MIKSKLVNHSIRSLTERIMEEFDNHTFEEINEIIKKEMGNFYNSSHLCFSIEESIYLIYKKIPDLRNEEERSIYGKDVYVNKCTDKNSKEEPKIHG